MRLPDFPSPCDSNSAARLAAFRPQFRFSEGLKRCEALIAATHSLSFYSLTLQHGVPFQPVSIRASSDPLGLLGKVLHQNPKSYTKLDDLISIGRNFVAAGLPTDPLDDEHHSKPVKDLELNQYAAEMRVTGMAIEAALAEDDFETAYSYVVTRLTPQQDADRSSSPNKSRVRKSPADDVAWRAALLAGKYRPSGAAMSMHSSTATSTPPSLRNLEQRMELLSQALLLAPPSALAEVLTVWRRCEEEMTTLLAQEAAAESSFNDRADQRIPGGFDASGPFVQPRREVGRGAVEEAPMGLFDVARGAAAAFSKTAFPLRGSANASLPRGHAQAQAYGHERVGSGSDHEGTVRKRDMVANAVAGGLASGIGWVLGKLMRSVDSDSVLRLYRGDSGAESTEIKEGQTFVWDPLFKPRKYFSNRDLRGSAPCALSMSYQSQHVITNPNSSVKFQRL